MRYHARDMAVVRARGADIPIVLASATPSVESEVNARRGRYARLHLPERFGGQHLPAIEAIDLRAEGPPRGRFIAPRLADAVQDRARARRAGAAVPQPPRLCAAHALPAMRLPSRLPELRRLAGRPPLPAPSRLPPLRLRDAAAGAVLRTARPPTRSSRSAPASSGSSRRRPSCFPTAASWCSPATWSNRWSACARNWTTSPKAASTSSSAPSWSPRATISRSSTWSASSMPISVSSNGDPRAAERTFQLLHQVVGRAGREEGRGVGFLQTHQPEHPVMRALMAADRDAFYSSEIELREKTQYPPFGRLASLLVSASERPAAEGYARRLAALAPRSNEVRVLGPAEAPLAVVRGRHRFRLLLKSPRGFDLSAYLRDWLADAPKRQGQPQARGRHRPAELPLGPGNPAVMPRRPSRGCGPQAWRHRAPCRRV